jgi:hypothetical protein
MIDETKLQKTFLAVLNAMGDDTQAIGPNNLRSQMEFMLSLVDMTFNDEEWNQFEDLIFSDDPNETIRLKFGQRLRKWDNLVDVSWADGTEICSLERRQLVYDKLMLPEHFAQRSNEFFPVSMARSATLVIAERHAPWYTAPRQSERSFYWDAYKNYLQETAKWPDESIEDLDEASRIVVERLSDPEKLEIYATKGLVVGYVQSGKTANFTAVVAKAADAGYRLVIVLAGTLNLLRRQTQRRLDKELVGKELIEAHVIDGGSHEYTDASDWPDFIEHSAIPSDLGAFDWERLTNSEDDYQQLKMAIAALETQLRYPSRRANDPINLHKSPARLLVIKKNPAVMKKLLKDLGRLKTSLQEIPALIIDDESDQASINTRKPSPSEVKKRTATNHAIVNLLTLLPRAQYVGYTATPFANVFVDPSDSEDLFPKDYIVSLKRPMGYMGVRDFFDLAEDGGSLAPDEKPTGFHSAERAFIRDIIGEDEMLNNLPLAIDHYILAGAIKLFRSDHGVSVSTRHHTMLVHRSNKQIEHKLDAELVEQLFDAARYGRQESYDRMETILDEDFQPVHLAQDPDLPFPDSMDQLKPWIDQCLSKVQTGEKPVLVVNGDPRYADDNPSFDIEPVWKILVGGTKLSRGYTVEGLTVSYYRRKILTGDTLMQVGRWFGFRRGYRDLVRLFLGRAEPGKGNTSDGQPRTVDLYEAFEAICKDEELFRTELRRYAESGLDNPITPKQVPPLVPSHLLMPSARNKMFNAKVHFENYGNKWVERVLAPYEKELKKANGVALRKLLDEGKDLGEIEFSLRDPNQEAKKRIEWSGEVFRVTNDEMVEFLKAYKWMGNKPLLQRPIEFLTGSENGDPGVREWIVIGPRRQKDTMGMWLPGDRFRLMKRSRLGGEETSSFKAFSERRHRLVARYLSGLDGKDDEAVTANQFRGTDVGVAVVYHVVEKPNDVKVGMENDQDQIDALVTIGLGLQFPENKIPISVRFGVNKPNEHDAVIIDCEP